MRRQGRPLGRLLLGGLLLAGCPEPSQGPAPLQNRCALPLECEPLGRCDQGLRLCVANETVVKVAGYEVVLLVTTGNDPRSAELVPRYAQRLPRVTGSGSTARVIVPSARRVRGRVLVNGVSVEAELGFTPLKPGLPLRVSVSAFTQVAGSDEHVFEARLEPEVEYEVSVFPRGKRSGSVPPTTFRLPGDAAATHDFSYGELAPMNVRLREETMLPPVAGLKLRLVREETGEVVSSTGTSDVDGGVSLYAPKAVLAEQLASTRLVIGTRPVRVPWREIITFEGEDLAAQVSAPEISLVIPRVPAPVPLEGSVESGGEGTGEPLQADVTFVSDFSVPRQTPGQDLRGRDWCRLRVASSVLPRFQCHAEHTVSVAPGELLRAELLPGDYRVFVVPQGFSNGTTEFSEEISTQPDGSVQAGRVFRLGPQTRYDGTVASPFGDPMPLVTVQASALRLVLPGRPVTRYNREAETLSDPTGAFSLTVDPGYYDLLVTPPEGSGFPAYVRANRLIEAQPLPVSIGIRPDYPLVLRGEVGTQVGALAGARVEAYAIVPDLVDPSRERVVPLARTVSDESGSYALILPTRIEDPLPSEADAGAPDAGDAGMLGVDSDPVRLSDSGR